MKPTEAWVIVREGRPVHVRLTEGLIRACAMIERDVYHETDVKVVHVVMTEITDEAEFKNRNLEEALNG